MHRRHTMFTVAETVILVIAMSTLSWAFGWWSRGQVEAHEQWRITPITVGEPEPPLAVTVRVGDTLWGIAREFYPSDRYDTRHVVEVIRRMNPELDPGRLQPDVDIVYLPRPKDL